MFENKGFRIVLEYVRHEVIRTTQNTAHGESFIFFYFLSNTAH
jgi:hypothetical protein